MPETWQQRIDRRLMECERQVATLVKKDEIAQAVADKLKEQRNQFVSLPVKLAGVLVGLLTIVSLVLQIRAAA